MSVQTQIDRIKANIASAYTKAQEKGAELPPVQNSANLPATIEAIPSGAGMHTISVSADPPEGGSVFGGGMASEGMRVTISAVPAEGTYLFGKWTENGQDVSSDAEFALSVTGDRTLTAVFFAAAVTNYTVTLLADPADGGTVSGGGTYPDGTQATVSASPANGYRFAAWIEDGGE